MLNFWSGKYNSITFSESVIKHMASFFLYIYIFIGENCLQTAGIYVGRLLEHL